MEEIMEAQERVRLLAHYEIGWWQAHHRKQEDEFTDNMSKLYALQFGIDETKARVAVLLRLDATKHHDKAEQFEDKGNQESANLYWNKAEECLRQHFEILEGSL